MAALMWLTKKNLEVKNIELFDYKKFIDKGEKYLFEFYNNEVAEEQIKNSLISQEIEISKQFIKKVKTEVRLPDINEIKSLLDKGFLIGCNVNSHALSNKKGYAGHFVIVRGYDSDGFFINDPGLLGKENRKVSFRTFEKSWAYPNNNTKNIMAVRKLNNK